MRLKASGVVQKKNGFNPLTRCIGCDLCSFGGAKLRGLQAGDQFHQVHMSAALIFLGEMDNCQ